MSRVRRYPAGFTLVELLVVIAIITILAALLVPALNRSRLAAGVANTQEELHSLQAAIADFEEEFGLLLPAETLPATTMAVNTQFLDPRYRSGDTSVLSGGNESWAGIMGWLPMDNDRDHHITATDMLYSDASRTDGQEFLYLLVGTRFRRLDDVGRPVGVLVVGRIGSSHSRVYYAPSVTCGPYAELSGSRIGDLDGDGFPEVLDSFGNPILFTRGLRMRGAVELCSLGPDEELDFVDSNGDGMWTTGEPRNNGIDDDGDGLVDEKRDEINHVPELRDDIVTWQ